MAYNPPRKRDLFDPNSDKPYRLSRTRLERYLGCPRCFYIDRRLGVDRPGMPGFTLNIAVDELLKKEFDTHRANGEAHPLMKSYGVDAIPYDHEKLEEWRNNFKGVSYHHEPTNLVIFGAVDDVWVQPDGQLIVVDYKATSTRDEIKLEGKYKEAYKRQMEIYQWLLRQNGFDVSDTGYFVYVNGDKDKEAFDAKLDFKVELIPYTGSDSWVEDAIKEAHACLVQDKIPESNAECEYCMYRRAMNDVEMGV